MTRPVFVGLTGGVGAGKSEALAAFARLGAETISSDEVVHEILRTPEARDRLVERWGEEVAPGREVDRERVAQIVFGRPEELEWLESVLHPRVGERIEAWRRELAADAEVAVVEVPLLFEAGMGELFDAVVCVVADDAVRERRAADRGLGDLEGRTGRQLSQEEKAARATHVVSNDASLADLEAEIAEVMRTLVRSTTGR